MTNIQLFDFQNTAVDQMIEATVQYFKQGPDRMGGRQVPFIGQLKAVTGAGKTPILASVVGRLGHALVLWTTVYGSVVEQTVRHLRPGGKYHHLFGSTPVEVLDLREIGSLAQRERILTREKGVTILVSTVAAWNSSGKDERLNVHRVGKDSGPKSLWDQLKEERQRPLWVVYDEAHNTTSDQVDLLDELDPAGFFVASASPLKGKLHTYLAALPPDQRQRRVVPVRTRDVVDAQLLKATISVADYASSVDEMLADATRRRDDLEQKLAAAQARTIPKAIYVVESSNLRSKEDPEPRPIAIWKTLVNNLGVSPSNIAVCTNTKDLPADAIKVTSVADLSDQYTHIIFNKKLQEGWDDPSVYIAYFDGKMESPARVQQVVGRALRQPEARHLEDEDLNTAFFFVNCPSEVLDTITNKLKEELRIYKDDDDGDDYEPVRVKSGRGNLPKIPLKQEWQDRLKVPQLVLELPDNIDLAARIRKKSYDFADDERSSPGRALVSVVSVRTGDVSQNSRDLLEDMRIRCGVYLQDQIRVRSMYCAHSLDTKLFSNDKLDKTACYGSQALEHYRELAQEVVDEYQNKVELQKSFDLERGNYVVESYQPSGSIVTGFSNAAHPHYDSKTFNLDELPVAKALDKFSEYVWVRNKPKLHYKIELPAKSGSSSAFYPDFLWWVKDTVWAIDPTGKFILDEKIRTKLLVVPAPLKIALMTRGKLGADYKLTSEDGWTLLKARLGNPAPEVFDDLDGVLKSLISAS